MSLNEPIVEDAALLMPAASLNPAFYLRPSPLRSGSHREKQSERGKLVGRLRGAIQRLDQVIPKEPAGQRFPTFDVLSN